MLQALTASLQINQTDPCIQKQMYYLSHFVFPTVLSERLIYLANAYGKKGYYVVGFVFLFKPFNIFYQRNKGYICPGWLIFFYLLNKSNFILMQKKKADFIRRIVISYHFFRTTLLNKASEVHNLFDGSFQTNQLKLNFFFPLSFPPNSNQMNEAPRCSQAT